MNRPYDDGEGRVVLPIIAQPRAKHTEVTGWHGDAIKIRVAAPPADGAANAELIRLLAQRLLVPRSPIRLLSGATGRRKRIEVTGVAQADAYTRLGLS